MIKNIQSNHIDQVHEAMKAAKAGKRLTGSQRYIIKHKLWEDIEERHGRQGQGV